MKISILGTIVSADYDDPIFGSWIEKGVITPSSRIVSALESNDEPVELYINSYGGDVFAGGEMMIALQKAFAAGRIKRCEVGSLAASMAANIVASLKAMGAPVVAHTNSQLMFHGCYTATEGGAQHHEDVAASLRNINESVIASLNKIGINECRAWFAEGREKWISSDEGLKLGLFDSIDFAGAESPVDAKRTASRLAAFATTLNNRKDYSMKIDETIQPQEPKAETEPVETPATETAAPVAEPTTETPAESAPEPTPETPAADDIEARVEALANERFARLQSAHDKKISDLTTLADQTAASLASVTTERDQLKAEIEKLNDSHAEELASLRAQLDAEKKAHEAVTASALKPVAEDPWTSAYRAARKIKK